MIDGALDACIDDRFLSERVRLTYETLNVYMPFDIYWNEAR